MQLSKKEKKIARDIIESGLQKESTKVLLDAEAILKKWKSSPADSMNSYHELFKHLTKFDKYLARRYDGMTGSNYLLIIIGQLRDGIISEGDLEKFPDKIRGVLNEFS